MKNLRFIAFVLLLTTSCWSALAQEQLVVADAKTVQKEKEPVVGEVIKAGEEPARKEDEETPAFTLSGSVDTYFHSTFGTTNSFYGAANAPSTSFSDLKGFGLGMANFIASYQGDKAGFIADVVFGPRGQAAVFGTTSGQAVINQMFAYYKLTPAITLNLGQFNTFLGYEVISPAVNFHYSTSYLFSWGPFNHTGLRADIDMGRGLVAKLAVMNPTDIVEFNPVNTYTFGGQVGFTNDKGGIWLNALYGDQDGTLDPDEFDPNVTGVSSAGNLFQVDLTTGWSLTEKFYLGFNTSMQSIAAGQSFTIAGEVEEIDAEASSFMGFAVYPKLTLSESFALGLRAEYFSTKNSHFASPIIGVDTDGAGSVMEFTLSGNYKTGGLTFVPEFRIDKTSEDSFLNGTTSGSLLPSLTLAAIYKF